MKFRLSKVLILASLLCVFSMSACGKKTAPRAPEALAPSPVRFLTAKARVDKVELIWEAPNTNASGDKLLDLTAFRVKRANVEDGEVGDFDTIAEVSLSKFKAAPTLKKNTGRSSQGENLYRYEDKTTIAGRKYQYLVVGLNDDGVEGEAASSIRVTFIGESSIIESFSAAQR